MKNVVKRFLNILYKISFCYSRERTRQVTTPKSCKTFVLRKYGENGFDAAKPGAEAPRPWPMVWSPRRMGESTPLHAGSCAVFCMRKRPSSKTNKLQRPRTFQMPRRFAFTSCPTGSSPPGAGRVTIARVAPLSAFSPAPTPAAHAHC